MYEIIKAAVLTSNSDAARATDVEILWFYDERNERWLKLIVLSANRREK